MQGVTDQLRVVILAAGRGRRLAPFTDGTPKCLVPVGSTSALGLLFAWLRRRKPAEVILVTGHARHRIRRFVSEQAAPFPVREIFNPKYDSTNNIYSAALSRDFCRDGFLLLNSDLICHPQILDAAVDGSPSTFLVVDPALPPRPEAMKVRYAAGRLVAIGKDLDPGAAQGEYIGMARFDRGGAKVFFEEAHGILTRGGTGEWYEAAIGAAATQVAVGWRSTGGLPWIEIDDPEDLRRAAEDVVPGLARA